MDPSIDAAAAAAAAAPPAVGRPQRQAAIEGEQQRRAADAANPLRKHSVAHGAAHRAADDDGEDAAAVAAANAALQAEADAAAAAARAAVMRRAGGNALMAGGDTAAAGGSQEGIRSPTVSPDAAAPSAAAAAATAVAAALAAQRPQPLSPDDGDFKEAAHSAAGRPAGAVDELSALRDMMRAMQQQMAQQQLQHLQQQQQLHQQMLVQQQQLLDARAAPAASTANALLLLQKQISAQTLLQASGSLAAFHPKATPGAGVVLYTQEWIAKAESWFSVRERATGASGSDADEARVLFAVNALEGEARRWYETVPSADKPKTWAAFVKALRDRYCAVPDGRVRVDQLRQFVKSTAKVRNSLTLSGLQGLLNRFQELAAQIPSDYLTLHGKLAELAAALPAKYAETVLKEDAKEPPTELHTVAAMVLARAAVKEHSAAYSDGAAGSSVNAIGRADSIALAMNNFGIDRETASSWIEESEGWAPHDTDGKHAGPTAAAPAAGTAAADTAMLSRLLAAFTASQHSAPKGDSQGGNSRRGVPGDVAKQVPADLAAARKEAGLCIKCGVHKYEPGGKGHNSRTCRGAVDLKTSVADGKKKAGF
jgi:hypothetical protein